MLDSISLHLRTVLQRIQSKLAFEGWLRYPQFSTKMVRLWILIPSARPCCARLIRRCCFHHAQGLGRVAMLACILGILWGIHFIMMLFICLYQYGIVQQTFLGPDRMQLLLQWCLYVVVLSTFHFLEFFVTAFYNPYVTSSDSFLINHSIAYTAAALVRNISSLVLCVASSFKTDTLSQSTRPPPPGQLSWTEFWIHFWYFPQFNTSYMMVLGLVMILAAQCIRTLAMATCGESFNHLIQVTKKENHVLVTHGM